jgi:hypothetical protein
MPPLRLVSGAVELASNCPDCTPPRSRVFLLSPANISAVRGQLLLNGRSEFELARRLREQGAPLGELFSFISSLYFRGKLAYARSFSVAPPGLPAMFVMTTSRGLLSPDTMIAIEDLLEMSHVPIDTSDSRYRDPLCRDARVPRLCCSAVSPAANMSSRCSKLSAPVSYSLKISWDEGI